MQSNHTQTSDMLKSTSPSYKTKLRREAYGYKLIVHIFLASIVI